jgi:hypothetical protein
MPIPGKSHKNVGNQEKSNGGKGYSHSVRFLRLRADVALKIKRI